MWCTAGHNLVLSLGSAVMMLGALYEMYRRSQAEGLSWMLCEDPDTKPVGPLYFWCGEGLPVIVEIVV